jgi:cytoskeletal protein RodZ
VEHYNRALPNFKADGDEEWEFIHQSKEFREREIKEKEEAQKAKERQKRRNIIALFVGLVIAVVLSFVSFVMW